MTALAFIFDAIVLGLFTWGMVLVSKDQTRSRPKWVGYVCCGAGLAVGLAMLVKDILDVL